MKIKNIIIAGLITGFLVCTAGCGIKEASQYPWKITESERDIRNADDRIVLQAEKASVTAEGMRISIQNNSDAEITFGTEYFIQLREDGSWYDIDADTDWTMELMAAEPGQVYEEELDWSSYYGELPPGTYRIVKEYEKAGMESFMFCEFDVSEAESPDMESTDAEGAAAEQNPTGIRIGSEASFL